VHVLDPERAKVLNDEERAVADRSESRVEPGVPQMEKIASLASSQMP